VAISESVGAARAGEGPLDVLRAGTRGLSRGYTEREYPSVGSQLSPDDEGEALVIDLFTDPLMILPLGRIARGGASLMIRGGAQALGKGGKLEGVGKGIRVATRSETAQRLGRLVMPLRNQLSLYGVGGKAVGLKAARAEENVAQKLAGREASFLRKLEQLGLDRDIVRRGLVRTVRETGKPSGDAAVDELAKFLGEAFDTVGVEANELGLLKEWVPNYFPRMLKREVIETLERTPSGAVEKLAKMLKIPVDEAEDIWRFNTGRPRKAGHLENPRTREVISEEVAERLFDRDPLSVYPRYLSQATRRIEYAREFGKNFENLDALLERAKRSGMPSTMAKEVRSAIRDPISPEGKIVSKDAARRLLGAMVVTKMGPTSTIANLSQNANPIVVDGGVDFLKGLLRARDQKVRARGVVAYHRQIKETFDQLLGGAAEAPIVDLPGLRHITPQRYLRWTAFTPAETVNRILSASSGVVTAERLAKEAKVLGRILPTRELVRRGVDKKAFRYFLDRGDFPEQVKELIGLRFANRTQHVTNYLEIPLAWRSPEGRLFTQYKSFVYQQSRFIGREILSPAAKWVATDGKQGSIAPLLRAGVAFGIAGEVVAGIRAFVRGDDRRKLDSKHPLSRLISNATYVGAFGMASHIVDNALRGKTIDYFAGPTISEGAEIGESLLRFAADPEVPEFEDISRQLYRRLGRGPAPFLAPLFKR
jgi:hypothetical protein